MTKTSNSFESLYEVLDFGMWRYLPQLDQVEWNSGMYNLYQVKDFAIVDSLKKWKDLIGDRGSLLAFDDFFKSPVLNKSICIQFSKNEHFTRFFQIECKLIQLENGNIQSFEGTVKDVTEFEETRKTLIAQNDFLKKSLDSRADVINEMHLNLSKNESLMFTMSQMGAIGGWYYDIERNKFDWSSQVFEIHDLPIGTPPNLEEMIKFYAPEARGVLIKKFDEGKAGEDFEFELPLLNQKGDRIWVFVKAKPVTENGKVIGIDGILQEVTEQKKIRENLILINENLDQRVVRLTDQLNFLTEELETFSYTISHDLRAPIRAIEGFANALLEEFGHLIDEDGKSWMNYILKSTDRMGKLINDILVFSRVGRLVVVRQEINVNEMIQEAFEEMKSDYSEKVVKLHVDKLLKINADIYLLSILWKCLLGNALKFSSKKEVINIEIKSWVENEQTIFEIKDHGAGFDDTFIHKLFVIFQRLHGSSDFAGSGVGLAIAERIVQKHNGWIKATGKIGEGATFTFAITNH